MENKRIANSILETVRAELAAFIEVEGQITSSKEYEEKLLTLCQHFGRAVIEQTQGQMPKSRNAKKKF